MDSGNSGSIQSSSGGGGEHEYDSRGESISSFLNSSAHFGSIPVSQSQLLSNQPTNFFNPNSQNLDAFNPQSLGLNPSGNSQFGNNNDLVGSRGLRSQSNYANFGNLSSSSSSAQSVLGNTQGLTHHHLQPPLQSNIDGNNSSRPSQQSDHKPNTVKNPKKRTRASRRAPTTVLTTDPTNFRQMVQEFTGIPTAPFSGSPYSSRRLDLFSSSSGIRSGHFDHGLGPLYPLRPSAQKLQLNPFFPPSNNNPSTSLLNSGVMDASLVPTTTTTITDTKNSNNNLSGGFSSAISNHDYQITSNLGPNPKQPQQNPMLAFQPLLLKNPTSILGLGHDQNVNVNLGGFLSQGINSAGTGDHHQGHHELGLSSQHNSNNNYKFNCLDNSASDQFHSDKGLENVTSTGEGTVGSWICPSD